MSETKVNEVVELVVNEQSPNVSVKIQTELTPEELLALKEIARDRLAVSRVWGRTKTFVLALAGVIVAYITIVENGVRWLKNQLGM
jgi:hypothetical protein